MKHIINYIGSLLAVVLISATFTACSSDDDKGSANVGLGIKVFSPTKVVTNQPMTINGSGFSAATEIEFPNGVKVTNFEIVSDDMIRVDAPAGIAAEGGKLIVRTATEEAESRLPLTIGHTDVTGFDKQPGDNITGGDLITIFGKDLEFIKAVEFLDAEGNPQLVDQKDFYRKGTSNTVVRVPLTDIYKGTFVGYIYTYDGQKIPLPEMAYEPNSGAGYWETVENIIWEGVEDLSGGAQPYIGTDGGAEFIKYNVQVGEILRFYIEPTEEGWWFEVWEGHWAKQYGIQWTNETNPEIQVGAPGYIEIEVTEDIYNAAVTQQWWGGIFVVQGKVILSKVTIVQEVWHEPEGGGGGDLTTTIWDTETVFDGWGATILIGPENFTTVRAGDIVRVYIKDKGSDYNPIYKHEDWSDWSEFQTMKVDEDEYFEAPVPAEAIAELQEKGLRFQGVGFTITKVDLIQPGAGGGGASGPVTIWDTETVFDGWSATIMIGPENFADAKVGNIVRVTIKDKGADYNPIYKHEDWSDWTEFQSNKTDGDDYFEAPIPDGALDELTTIGLRFQGVGFTIVKVELIP